MYRSDKQFMKNPATASSRIYIGSIPETVVAADLEERFRIHGTILGLALQRGFGFIQFEADEQAQAAIRKEHGTILHGRKLNVRQAVDKSRLNNPPQNIPTSAPAPPSVSGSVAPSITQPAISKPAADNPPSTPKDNAPPLQKENPPEEMDISKNEDEFQNTAESAKQTEAEMEHQTRSSDANSDTSDKRRRGRRGGGSIGRNNNNRSRERDRLRDHDRYPDDYEMRDIPPRDMPLRDMPPRDLPPRDMPPFYGRDDPYRSGPAYVPPPIMDRPDRNDCEIIVVSRLLTEYAEYIEQRLKSVGLMVDLLYPNEDVPLGRVLANISSRGCLYAILVMPQNEEYRSLTLSILHGIPQEHRNMPVDDAIVLITRNFDAYMRGEKIGPAAGGTGTGSLTDRHPEPIQMVLNLLAENRQITTAQYDRLLKYLQDRRELQSQFEIAEGGGESKPELESNSKQAELQSRIMNILNKSSDDSPKPVEAPIQTPGPTPLLNDPSVQKALDSLLSGDMFKTISSGF
ncbi:hypothetical protein ILUMI_13407 [Ignelater luminosus]|uniref:RRM domain-containing protein n=1 Tax=Ignelater luminosus TaxID=2038154 RepID=A0A8K0CWT4_IGNLU|nr:hypothetical protein ILUMI_13407 [Ignelater luminosus]